MSMGFRADPTGTSGVITVAGVDQVVVTNASNVAATTFTGALVGNAATATKLSTATGVTPSYSARAWVNFDGTKDTSGATSTADTPRFIRASGNVSSVSRNGVGFFTVNFTVDMPDVNYSSVGMLSFGNVSVFQINSVAENLVTSSKFVIRQTDNQLIDPTLVNIVFFR
jgi:hypothetical protein